MPRRQRKPFTKKQELKIRKEYLKTPIKTLEREMGILEGRIHRFLKRHGLKIPKKIRDARRRSTQFAKGSVSANRGKKQSEYMSKEAIERTKATRFKRRHVPNNAKYDGHERPGKDGYILIRTSLGVYESKHVVEWEKVNGKIPGGLILNCIDGDKTNCNPNNWTLVSRQEHMLKNSIHEFPKEVIPSMVLVGKIKKKIKNLKDAT